MAGHLAGKNIAVTGAGNGIGRGIALACAAEGANVVVADYGVTMDGSDPSSEVADVVVDEIRAAGGTAIAVAGDVSEMAVGQRIVDTAVQNWGTIDGVVCVAGIVRERMLFNMSEEEFDHVVGVHLKGHFTLYRAASAVMRKQETGGSLVGFTSGAFVASTAQANYSAAKGGIVSLTRSAAFALRRYGINANCIAPARVLLRPAGPGTGVIAGGAMRAVLESVGVRDVLAKSKGSSNPHSVVKATIDALTQLRDAKTIAQLRGVSLDTVFNG